MNACTQDHICHMDRCFCARQNTLVTFPSVHGVSNLGICLVHNMYLPSPPNIFGQPSLRTSHSPLPEENPRNDLKDQSTKDNESKQCFNPNISDLLRHHHFSPICHSPPAPRSPFHETPGKGRLTQPKRTNRALELLFLDSRRGLAHLLLTEAGELGIRLSLCWCLCLFPSY
jgi:hypothetical protein